jgi:hypothetical protein
LIEAAQDTVRRTLWTKEHCTVVRGSSRASDAGHARDLRSQLPVIREWLAIGTHDRNVGGAAQYLLAHLIAKTFGDSQSYEQRRNTHRDSENRNQRGRAGQPVPAPGTEVTQRQENFVGHLRQSGESVQFLTAYLRTLLCVFRPVHRK